MSNFLNTAASRETSADLMAAILWVAGSEDAASRVWESPTEPELLAIWERVTKNGLIDASEFCWGAAGGNWAKEFGVEAE